MKSLDANRNSLVKPFVCFWLFIQYLWSKWNDAYVVYPMYLSDSLSDSLQFSLFVNKLENEKWKCQKFQYKIAYQFTCSL